MSELKEITMIFNGKPSEESFRKFVKVMNEIYEENKLMELKEQ